MLLIVFGAGASYDSIPSLPPNQHSSQYRLPLADQLFDNRPLFKATAQEFSRCLPIVPFLHRRVGNASVESLLEEYAGESKTIPERIKQLAAVRYYLQSMLFECQRHWEDEALGQTNYIALLDEALNYCNAKPIVIVTFNYDTLIERAIRVRVESFGDVPSYISGSVVKLFKLHGSINWLRQFKATPPVFDAIKTSGIRAPSAIIERIESLELTEEYALVNKAAAYQMGPGNNFGLPALAIPLINKNSYECPRAHVETLSTLLPEVTKLLIVGWRGTEAHFTSTLARFVPSYAPALVVAENDVAAQQTVGNLQRAGVQVQFYTQGQGFSDFVLGRHVRDWVRPKR